MKYSQELQERFWKKVTKTESCWLWTGSTGKGGYGRFRVNTVLMGAHQFSYELHIGPRGIFHVCHSCDVRNCVNPNHLFLGTNKENMEDMTKKGKRPRLKFCKRGHEMTPDNLYITKREKNFFREERSCKTCNKAAHK